MGKYIIGSGWYCKQPGGTSGAVHGHPQVGEAVIRGLEWHEVWKYFLFRYTQPTKVIVIDSASPYKPKPDPRIEWVQLDENYQYNSKTHFNGWIRGFMLGAAYAWNCNANFIYVEQDCLVVGKNWMNAVERAAEGEFPLFGQRFRSPVQQSLVYLPYASIQKFLYLLTAQRNAMTCEQRFHNTSKGKAGLPYKNIPFGVGRARPIDWKAKHLYAQHWSKHELTALGKREGVNGMIRGLLGGGDNEGCSVHTDPVEQCQAAEQESA